jgi:hypothetical protein
MITKLCIPLTLKIMGLGRPLYEAERIAMVMIVWVVLLCAMMGYTIHLPGVPGCDPDDLPGSRGSRPHGTARVNGCGIFPAGAGTAAGFSRVLLHT